MCISGKDKEGCGELGDNHETEKYRNRYVRDSDGNLRLQYSVEWASRAKCIFVLETSNNFVRFYERIYLILTEYNYGYNLRSTIKVLDIVFQRNVNITTREFRSSNLNIKRIYNELPIEVLFKILTVICRLMNFIF